jgi:hypothetical protein
MDYIDDMDMCFEWFGWDYYDFPLFKEVVISRKRPFAIVMTRTGGVNRVPYEFESTDETTLDNYDIRELQGFRCDVDATWNSNYAYWIFQVDQVHLWKEYCTDHPLDEYDEIWEQPLKMIDDLE